MIDEHVVDTNMSFSYGYNRSYKFTETYPENHNSWVTLLFYSATIDFLYKLRF